MQTASIRRNSPASCLYCGARMESIRKAVTRCAVCDGVMTRADLETYRTLAPRARRLQRLLIGGLGLSVLGGTLVIWQAAARTGERALVMAVVALIIAAAVAYDTISLTTRRRSRFDPAIVYPAGLVAAGVVPFLAGMQSAPMAVAWILAGWVVWWGITTRLRAGRAQR